MKNPQDPLSLLKEIDSQIRTWKQIGALLGWDQETYLPEGAVEDRARQLAQLETHVHSLITSPALAQALEALESHPPQNPVDQDLVRHLRRTQRRSVKIPADLVERKARHVSLSQAAWAKARKTSDFAAFQPFLETMVALTKETADCLGWTTHPYDALLDEYEPGMTASEVQKIFDRLQPQLSQLVKTIAGKSPLKTEILHRSYPRAAQEVVGKEILTALGFDWNRGRLDVTTHPFCTTLGDDDVRLTTRYNEHFFNEAVYGMIHEAGHGLYEQGFGPEIRGTSLADGTSLGIHESQSRFWENTIGRSLGFVQHFFPLLQKNFPEALGTATAEDFYQAINAVEPSFIRVEADEVTYNLHIILRFRLEMALLDGSLKVSDLPAVWNREFTSLFGITPPDDAQGCLQDVHWSMGGLGYFPTYALGNLYAAQWRAYLKKSLDLDGLVARGEFSPLLEWLRTRIHTLGSRRTATELCRAITGEDLNPQYFLDYIQEKYGKLYDF